MNKPDTAERWALLRTMLGTDGIVASEALTEMCGMVELMLDPHKHHKDRLRYGRLSWLPSPSDLKTASDGDGSQDNRRPAAPVAALPSDRGAATVTITASKTDNWRTRLI